MLNAVERLIVALIIVALFVVLFFRGTAYAEPHLRLTVGHEVLHAPGYSFADVRYGDKWGVRAGLLKAPSWASSVPDQIKVAKPQFDLENIGYLGVDREFCGERWCAGLGVAKLTDTSWANGTEWNFIVSTRFQINHNWSLEYMHFSHGSALGIAKDKSNRGWNFLGVGYAFR